MIIHDIMIIMVSIPCAIFLMYGLTRGKNTAYEAWKATKTDAYLEIFGHKEMTESTRLKILEVNRSE